MFSYLWISRPLPNNIEVANIDGSNDAIKIAQSPIFTPPATSNSVSQEQPENAGSDTPKIVADDKIIKVNNRKIEENRFANTNTNNQNINRKQNNIAPKSNIIPAEYIPGEDSYTKTIATLKSTVDGEKDLDLKPSERFAYEKDMAMINDAINKMKAEVKKNPKNEAAKQLLFASYQNKIDLLNSVSEKNDLVASITR